MDANPASDIPSDGPLDSTFWRDVFKNKITQIPNSDAEMEQLDTLYSQERENPTPFRLSSVPPSSSSHLPANSTVLEDPTATLDFPQIPSHLASPIHPQEWKRNSETPVAPRAPAARSEQFARSRFVDPKPQIPRQEISSPRSRKQRPVVRQREPSTWARVAQLVSTVMRVTALVLILTICVLLISTYLRPQPTMVDPKELNDFDLLREETTDLRAAIEDMMGQINDISQRLPDPKIVQEWQSLQRSKNWAEIALDAEIIPELTTAPFDPLARPSSWKSRLTKLLIGWMGDVDFTLDPQSLLLPRSGMCWPVPEAGGNVGIRLGAKIVLERVEISSQHPVDVDVYYVNENWAIVHAGAGSHTIPVSANSGVRTLLIKVHPSQVTCLYNIRAIGQLA